MHFRILGPLEVGDGELVAIGAPKHRSVLAALLLGANRAQSFGRLVDVVWDDRPPPTARNLICGYICQLRKALAAAVGPDAGRIVTKSPGYLMRVPDDQLDLLVFEQLVQSGRTYLAQHQYPAAATRFHEALSLWRGPALADVSSRLITLIDVPRLEETRLGVWEECIEADLALGLHAQVIAELEALTAEYPFRERLHRHFLLALYRSGRRSEAIRHYQRVRTTLVTELGLEPGQEMQRMMRAILADDQSQEVAPANRATLTTTSARPMQIPSPVADFTGRRAELARVADMLPVGETAVDSALVLVITGMPGVGKSALAHHAAHRWAERFPDGQLYANLRGSEASPLHPDEVLIGFLRALGLPGQAIPDSRDERTSLFRTHLAGRRLLVLLDDVAQEENARPLLPIVPGCAALVTSRAPLAGLEGAGFIRLTELPTDDALRLLSRIVGESRACAERPAAREIVRLCGNLPLAVRVAGVRLVARPHWSLESLAARLADPERRLGELTAGDLGVRKKLAGGYSQLDGEEQRAVRLLGLLPGAPIATWPIASLLNRHPAVVQDILDGLAQQHLLRVVGREPRYQQLPLIRDLSRELQADDPDEVIQARLRLLRAYLAATSAAQDSLGTAAVRWRTGPEDRRRMEPLTGTDEVPWREPHAWYRRERRMIQWCGSEAFRTETWILAWRLALAQTAFFELDENLSEWEHAHRQGLRAARRVGDTAAQAAFLDGLAYLHVRRGQWQAAMATFAEGLALAETVGDQVRQAYVLQSVSELHARQGYAKEAAEFLDLSRKLFVEAESGLRSQKWALDSPPRM